MSLSGTLCGLAAGLAILLVPAPPAAAQAESDAEWKVVTVARDGAWGLSSARSQGEAIAGAVRQCQSRSGDLGDCGAELVAYRIGCPVSRSSATACALFDRGRRSSAHTERVFIGPHLSNEITDAACFYASVALATVSLRTRQDARDGSSNAVAQPTHNARAPRHCGRIAIALVIGR